MKKIEILIVPYLLDSVKNVLDATGVSGITISEVKGNRNYNETHVKRVGCHEEEIPLIKLEVVVSDLLVPGILSAVCETVKKEKHGPGWHQNKDMIFVLPLDEAVRIRTGEVGDAAVV